jgi:hypothetical protein
VNSDSPEAACEDALGLIEHWGTDNNWRVACGSISKDTGEIYSTGEGRYDPKDIINSDENSMHFIKSNKKSKQEKVLEDLRSMVDNWISDEGYDTEKLKNMFNKVVSNERVDGFEYYELEKYISHKRSKAEANLEDWLPSYNNFKYDEAGVTDLTQHNEDIYCVFIDMHS